MRWPTTLILMSIVVATTVLGVQGTIDGQVVTTIFSAIVSGTLVGHYVKTTPTNGPPAPGTTTTTVTPESTPGEPL